MAKIERPDFAVVARTGDQIGEIPTWCTRTRALWWIDLLQPHMHRYDPASGTVRTWPTPELFSAFALRAGGGMVVATRTHLATFEPESGAFAPFCEPEPAPHANFLNDGRCDRRGRFWIGSGHLGMSEPTGRLHRLDADRSLSEQERGVILSNSLMWSPDDRLMYYADSMRRLIWVYDFDADAGTIRNRRLFADTSGRPGIPDGSIVDAEGFLWTAEFDMSTERTTGFVVRHAPDGRLDRVLELPTCRPTAVTFGGDDLATLFVVTSRYHMSEAELARQPLAGATLALSPGVRGLPEPCYAG